MLCSNIKCKKRCRFDCLMNLRVFDNLIPQLIGMCVGPIPTSFGSLTGLVYMDLNTNSFTGIYKWNITYAED